MNLKTHVILLAGFMTVAAAAENIPDLFCTRTILSTDGWQTIVDPYDSGFFDNHWVERDLSDNPARAETFYRDIQPTNAAERVEYNFDRSDSLKVPGDWNTQRPDLFRYEGSIWYRKKFKFKGTTAGQKIFLRFGAVNYRADVYLNGQKLGFHIGGFTPFSFEVTKLIRRGENSLVVRANNQRSADAVPTLNMDWWNYGGLTRDVTLVTVPEKFIADHRVWLESEATRKIDCTVNVAGAGAGEPVEISIPELGLKTSVATDADGRATAQFTPEKLGLWSPETPKLYTVKIRCGNDAIEESVGFRTIRTRGKTLLLNGRPVFLRGICIHEEFPLHGGGRVNSPEQAEQLLKWAKELNCNFVRLAHYPHNEAMTRLADRLGVLVWSEIPVYWTINWTNAATLENAEQQLTDEINRDANRASIIIWSLGNETPVGPARTEFFKRLAARARELDSTRLLSAAMERHFQKDDPTLSIVEDPLAEVVDVVSFNEYIGWYDGLPEKCSRVRWQIPYDKPVFISEFGGDAKQGLHGDKAERWTEEFQSELYRQTLPMLDKIDGLAGMAPWLLVDFRSPKRTLPGIQDGYNRKGLISSDGKKKAAFYILQNYYRRRTFLESP